MSETEKSRKPLKKNDKQKVKIFTKKKQVDSEEVLISKLLIQYENVNKRF